MSESDKQTVAALDTENTARLVALFAAGIDILTPYVVIYRDAKEFLVLEDGREIEVQQQGLFSNVSAAIPNGLMPVHLGEVTHYGPAADSSRSELIDEAEIKLRAEKLIRDAARAGVVLTIELAPEQPLAMGHYTMVAHTRTRSYRNG